MNFDFKIFPWISAVIFAADKIANFQSQDKSEIEIAKIFFWKVEKKFKNFLKVVRNGHADLGTKYWDIFEGGERPFSPPLQLTKRQIRSSLLGTSNKKSDFMLILWKILEISIIPIKSVYLNDYASD